MAARKWISMELRVLGKRPDRELAQQFGRSIQAIVTKRSQLGIPRFISIGECRRWSREEEAILGTDLDNEIARRLKRATVATTKRRQFLKIPHFWDRPWTLEQDKLLGPIPDRQLAQQLGRTLFSIQNRRLKLGIPPVLFLSLLPGLRLHCATSHGSRRGLRGNGAFDINLASEEPFMRRCCEGGRPNRPETRNL